MLTAVWLCSLW